MTPEAKIKKVFTDLAKDYKIEYINLIFTGEYGDPDKLILVPGGRPIFAEFKAGKPLDPCQVIKVNRYRALGYDVRVIDTRLAAINLAAEVLAK